MRWVVATVLATVLLACHPDSQLPQGPQPYLIVRVLNPAGKLVLAGTIAPDISFEHSGESADHQDGIALHGAFIERTSSGFRIRWRAVQRTAGREARSIDKEEFAPWGAETQLESVEAYRVSVFYAPKTADQYFTREDITK